MVLFVASLMMGTIWGCGGTEQKSESQPKTEDVSGESSAEAETPVETETPAPTEEPEAEVTEENGMKKETVYTNKELGITGTTGTINYSINGVQVSKLTATTDEAATLLGVEKGKEITVVALDTSCENTSDGTVYFYIGQSTITTNTKEQVDADMILSDYIDGEFLGNVIHSGNIVYLLQNSAADQVESITVHVDAPTDDSFSPIGDEVTIDIPTK